MKINVIRPKTGKGNSAVYKVASKMYPLAEVNRKQNYKMSELEGSIVIDEDNFSKKLSDKEIAVKIIEVTGQGISEKVLESL